MVRKIKTYFSLVSQGFKLYDKILLSILIPLDRLFNIFNYKKEIYIKNECGLFKCRKLGDFYAYNEIRDKNLKPFFNLFDGEEIFIDVGANMGRWSFLIASKYKDSKIIAIEPDERSVSIFKDNLRLNKIEDRVEVIKKLAFYKDNFVKEFFINIDNSEKNTIYEKEIMGVEKYKGEKKHDIKYKKCTIKTITLDSIAKTKINKKIGLIKLDVQGAELDVLRGSRKLLSEDKPRIVFEAWDKNFLVKINEFLMYFGYEIKKIDDTNYFAYYSKNQ